MSKYSLHLSECINNLRALSIDEFFNTDLVSDAGIQGVAKWYDSINDYIMATPPAYYVKTLEIIENENGSIDHIRYIYYGDQDVVNDTIITINVSRTSDND